MKDYNKGDILVGEDRSFEGAYHPIIYIDGPKSAPMAVILTHADQAKYPCNIKLSGDYGEENSYFVAHLIVKMAEWGPYKKVGKVTSEDMNLIQSYISDSKPITWEEYMDHAKNGCITHS